MTATTSVDSIANQMTTPVKCQNADAESLRSSRSSSPMSYTDPHSPKKNRIEDDEAMDESMTGGNQNNNNDDNEHDSTLNQENNNEGDEENKRKELVENGEDDDLSFKVPTTTVTAASLMNDSVLSTKCEVSQTSVGLASESVLESSMVSASGCGVGMGREETDSGTSLPVAASISTSNPSLSITTVTPAAAAVDSATPKEVRLSEANAAVIGQQPPVESLNVKQVFAY